MSYRIIESLVGMQPIAETSTTQRHPLGMLVRAESDTYGVGEFIYALGVADTAVGSWVLISEDGYTTSLLAANDIGRVGVAMAANVANQYGWYQVSGKAVGKVLASFADNGNVYATATAGSVDDAVVAGDRVKQCKGASAIGTPSAGLAEFELDRPYMDDALAA